MKKNKTKSSKPKVIVLRTAGTNCDQEAVFAFESAGAKVDAVHINRIFGGAVKLKDYHIMVIPGGFTYGDDIESGRILANELRVHLADDIKKFIKDGKLIIGICNGFQVLVRAGILPGPLAKKKDFLFKQTATLTNNDGGRFQDRWIYLQVCGDNIWTKGLEKTIYFPIAHAEGKFVPQNNTLLQQLKDNGQVAFRYCNAKGRVGGADNPNGSVDDIAGITDRTGRILGLMPHPERHFLFAHHPRWTRFQKKGKYGDGAQLFRNGVDYVKKKLL